MLTPHSAYDLDWVAEHAKLVFDARNAFGPNRTAERGAAVTDRVPFLRVISERPARSGFGSPSHGLPALGKSRWTVVAIAVASAGAGLAEAGVLALIAYIATSMSAATPSQTSASDRSTSMAELHVLLVVAGVLAVVRPLLQIVVVRLPARLSGEVQSQLRETALQFVLGRFVAREGREKEGHLQELMGGQSVQAGNAVFSWPVVSPLL